MSAQDLAADLASRFGLRKRPRSWGGNCPSCSYHAAFSVKVGKKASRPLLYCANGCTREQLDEVAERALGNAWKPPAPADEQDVAKARAAKAAAAERLWAGSSPCHGTPAALYLARRGLPALVGCAELRHRDDCPHPEQARRPAMIARVLDVNGRLMAVHRTYLQPDGGKATIDPPKASLGPIWGGAVRLDTIAPELVIGEGIETAASAGLLLSLPAWAAISAGNMAAGLVLPPEVRSIVIAADHDGPGRKAAQDSALRWRREGRHVRVVQPDTPGTDFNDIWLASRGGADAE